MDEADDVRCLNLQLVVVGGRALGTRRRLVKRADDEKIHWLMSVNICLWG